MSYSQRDIDKYLRKALIRNVFPFCPPSHFRHMVVIPVFDELDYLSFTLKSLSVTFAKYGEDVALLLVVNHSPETPQYRKDANLMTLKKLQEEDSDFIGELKVGKNLFWIDAASAPDLEISGGVGEARKIGMDTALTLLNSEEFEASLIFALDADSLVAENYISTVEEWFKNHPKHGAASLGFRHQTGSTPEEERAIRLYEKYMLDYVENLRIAGSPYAFHTVGSSVVARATAYVACGGMRIRVAGEDFYYMQALKKVSPMGEINQELVYPAARTSDRVPFGTGASIRSQLAGEELLFYSPQAYAELKMLLEQASEKQLRTPELFRLKLSEYSLNFLESRNFFAIWPKLLLNLPKRSGAIEEAFHCWFDALKTVQFIKNFNLIP